jgi:hypothetical protein
MARRTTGPAGGRPPGRRGAGGVGPGPGYRPSSTGGGTTHNGGGCCTMAATVRAAKRGKFRLARRYARMTVRLIAARIA